MTQLEIQTVSALPRDTAPQIDEVTTTKQATWPDYVTIWRWHFYAGMLCIPILLILAVTGTIYLFKPQIQLSQYNQLVATAPKTEGHRLTVTEQINAALQAVPGSKFSAIELPINGDSPSQSTLTSVQLQQMGRLSTAYVSPTSGKLAANTFQDEQGFNIAKKLHGELVFGKRGSYLVETTACWTMVMVLTGLVLWWPRGMWKPAGLLFPRLSIGGRTFWKDIHSVAGFWVSGLVLFLIASGLPWATFWGDYFKSVRKVTGTAVAKQDWNSGHSGHRHGGGEEESGGKPYNLGEVDATVAYAATQNLLPPVLVKPPKDGTHTWVIQSDTPNRPFRTTIKYDAEKAAVVSRDNFADRHWIDRAVGQGIAIHEGARFGWPNQLLSLIATGGLVLLSLTALIMWWSRRQSGLGAPRKSNKEASISAQRRIALFVVLIAMSVAMPLFGLSLLIVAILDRVVLRRIPGVNNWLGLT